MKSWREPIVDPNKISFKDINVKYFGDYLPAGNDVLECKGIYKNNKIDFFLKIERGKFSDFENEVNILNMLKFDIPIPKVLEYGKINDLTYIALTKLNGQKMNCEYNKNNLFEYGKVLSKIHLLKAKTNIATQRKINDYPSHYKQLEEILSTDNWAKEIIDYLIKNKPEITFNTFIHGDFHYANILWNKGKIVGILDWEYAGVGFKEQDIAWTLILRPTQKFLFTIEEVMFFLDGYNNKGSYDNKKLKWCLINGYTHFFIMNYTNKEYTARLKNIIDKVMSII